MSQFDFLLKAFDSANEFVTNPANDTNHYIYTCILFCKLGGDAHSEIAEELSGELFFVPSRTVENRNALYIFPAAFEGLLHAGPMNKIWVAVTAPMRFGTNPDPSVNMRIQVWQGQPQQGRQFDLNLLTGNESQRTLAGLGLAMSVPGGAAYTLWLGTVLPITAQRVN